ncbi:unnamed protein product [Pocillopora meandrina]|uniref:DM domain-containing protein n=1 Tax=Pocillopora meandrina TaxID=46732 RepID=A0AAU9WMD3_9CNID|nr:unnamed protein product [Pocillopora meandrina]
MLSKSSCSDKGSDSRQKPKCTRCRNHGIYPVPLKGHRNVCPYKMCNCKHCILILERRLVSMKPESQTEGVREKSSKKKKTAKKTKQADVAEKKNMEEPFIEPAKADAHPTSLSQGNGHDPTPTVSYLPKTVNTGGVLDTKRSSPGFAKEQSRHFPECTNLSNPPLPYFGYLHCSPRMQNLSPGAPPNVTINPQGFHRMVIPEQPKWYLGYPPMDSPNYIAPYSQGFSYNPSALNLNPQRSQEPF